MAPIPIQFRFALSPAHKSASQVKAIQGLTQIVAELRAIEANNVEQQREPSSRFPPAFRIERLELDFRFFRLDPALLAEIQRFLQSGVRIHTLTLPEFPFEPNCDVTTWVPVWGSLLSVLIGNSAAPSVVRRLIVPTTYCEGILMPSLMSALPTATGIEYIQLEYIEHRRIDNRINWRLWAWLGFALVSGASTSSVKTLEFSGSLNERCVQALRQVKESANLLSCLWRTCAEQEAPASSPSPLVALHPATMLKGSMLFPQHCGQASGCFEAMNDIQGVFVPDRDEADETSRTVALMLPGNGFCTVERASLQDKQQRISNGQYPQSDGAAAVVGPNLQTFIIKFTGNRGLGCPAKAHIVDLLGVVGSTLTSLAIRADDVDDQVLQAVCSCVLGSRM